MSIYTHTTSTTRRSTLAVVLGVLILAVATGVRGTQAAQDPAIQSGENRHAVETHTPQHTATAIFAGGCFWCVEADFDLLEGVLSTESGYTGGRVPNASYEQVSAGGTGHREAVRIRFDPERLGYAELLEHFWHSVDPTDEGGQFCDRGESYTTAIFVLDERQRELAEASKSAINASGILSGPIVTPILDAGAFYAAESYHQDYYRKNPVRYKFYRITCGRDARIKALWGSSS